MKIRQLLSMVLFVGLCVHTAAAKQVVGWVENARIEPDGLLVKAKVDSGAKTSSLNCSCRQFFEKNGERWVRFGVTNSKGEVTRLERKVERMATIKRHFGESQERPVIKLGVCLGKIFREVEVNLVDRSGFNYQMLIGRSFLEGEFLIDPDKTYLAKPSCRQLK
jgi:hypothetical protein